MQNVARWSCMGKLEPQQDREISSMWLSFSGPLVVSIYRSNNNLHIGGS